MKRLSQREFGQIVSQAMETLPAEIRQHLDNVVVDIEEEPDEGTLRGLDFSEEEIAEGDSLYGLFAPIELPSAWAGDVVAQTDMPHRIIIYQWPLEEDFPDRRQLMIEIRKTVIHEVAHHFGYTDHDLERFDDNPNPFGENEDSSHNAG